MHYLLATFWPWLLGAFAIGLTSKWLAQDHLKIERHFDASLNKLLSLYVLGLLLAMYGFLPGRSGVWLETFLLMTVTYFLGRGATAMFMREIDVRRRSQLRMGSRVALQHAGTRPPGVQKVDAADDLTAIRGIDSATEIRLHEMGVYFHRQIAGWSSRHVTWVDFELGDIGRVTREGWVVQAQDLVLAESVRLARVEGAA